LRGGGVLIAKRSDVIMWTRVLDFLKKIPVVGWIITGALILLGLLGSRGRRDLGRPAPTRDPEEIKKAKEAIDDDLKEKETDIDDEWDDEADKWNDHYS